MFSVAAAGDDTAGVQTTITAAINQTLPIGFTGTLPTRHKGSWLTWRSSAARVATVDAWGRVTGRAVGDTVLTVTCAVQGVTYQAEAQLQITDAVMTDLRIRSQQAELSKLVRHVITVTAYFSDGSRLDISRNPSLILASDDQRVLAVERSPGIGKRCVRGLACGKAKVMATFQAPTGIIFGAEARFCIV
ncbi:TPA: hypothetical protein RUX41_004258 [Aeromonas dhakensis]|nr:hypothetical protein [Aeromonas dhakensis]